MADLLCGALIAGKGYDANSLVETIEAGGAQPLTRPSSNRIAPRFYGLQHRAHRHGEQFPQPVPRLLRAPRLSLTGAIEPPMHGI